MKTNATSNSARFFRGNHLQNSKSNARNTSHHNTINVLIVGADPSLHHALVCCMDEIPAVRVAGSAQDAAEALRMVEALHPQLVLLNVQIKLRNDLQTLHLIREFHPATHVFVLSTNDSDAVQACCLAQGADRFISKRWLCSQLCKGIQELFLDRKQEAKAKSRLSSQEGFCASICVQPTIMAPTPSRLLQVRSDC
jgi:DNA-binding NarL/FixJ family response regulator